MAPIRCALLGALALAADSSPITKWARRLSGPSDACMQACPNLEAFVAAMGGADMGHHDGHDGHDNHDGHHGHHVHDGHDGPDGGEHYTTTAADEHHTTWAADEQTTEEDHAGQGSPSPSDWGSWSPSPSDWGSWSPSPSYWGSWSPSPSDWGSWSPSPSNWEVINPSDWESWSPSPSPAIDMDDFETAALEAMQGMCQHQDVVSCLEENSDVCDVPEEEFQEVKSHLACICDLCPGIIEAQVGVASVFVNAFAQGLSNGAAGSPPDQDELEGTMCKLASCMQCAAEHPAQCAFMDMQGGMMNRRLSTMMDQMQMPNCPQDATCSASVPELDTDSAPRSFVAPLLVVIVPLLVVAK